MHQNAGKLAGKTVFITGASRGIGKAIALKAARDKANVVVIAKTADPHPKLPGTIYSVAKEIETAGGRCLPIRVDVREESQVQAAVDQTIEKFGKIDVLVNNASAISLTGTLQTAMKRYDLMNQINARGTFLTSKLCIPHLKKSDNPHIINMSPPLSLKPIWFKNNVAYTMAKYGMSMCVLGMAEEFKDDGIAVNALWPRTAIWTAAVEMLAGDENAKFCRSPEICADAFYIIATKNSRQFTGNFCVDEYLLKDHGLSDFGHYAIQKGHKLILDGFVDEEPKDDVIQAHWPNLADKETSGDVKHSGTKVYSGSSPSEIFRDVEHMLKSNADLKLPGTYIFQVEEETWFIDGDNRIVGKGEPSPSLVKLTMKEKDFIEVFSGAEVPVTAFMSGKIKIKGSMSAAVKLDKLFSAYKLKKKEH